MVTTFLALYLWLTAPAIKVDVMPRIALAPTTIRVTVRVEPDETNRGLLLVINSPSYYRSSVDPDFSGLDSPTIRNYLYELRYPGVYTVTAVIKRVPPKRDEMATVEVCLKGEDVEC